MEVLITFIALIIAFSWAIPQEEIDELNNRFKNK